MIPARSASLVVEQRMPDDLGSYGVHTCTGRLDEHRSAIIYALLANRDEQL